MHKTIRAADGRIVGWAHDDGCENPNCLQQNESGLGVHATPAGFAVTIYPNHFKTFEEAATALRVS